MSDIPSSPSTGERIAKVLARAGVCSRRDAEKLILARRVTVNGETIDSPALNVTEADVVMLDGEPLPDKQPTRLWRYNKAKGLVTTHKDPEGRPTVFDQLPPDLPRVISIGRLDLNSEGLLLLTNDGELARKLELPATGWVRRYRVRIHGRPRPDQLASLEKGVTVEGVRYGAIKATLDMEPDGANAWVTVSLTEGKNREIRKVMEHMGWPVTRLIRVAYGPFQLGNLEKGALEEVPGKILREQLGAKAGEDGGAAGKAGTLSLNRRLPASRKAAQGEAGADKPRNTGGWAKATPKDKPVNRKARAAKAKAEAGGGAERKSGTGKSGGGKPGAAAGKAGPRGPRPASGGGGKGSARAGSGGSSRSYSATGGKGGPKTRREP